MRFLFARGANFSPETIGAALDFDGENDCLFQAYDDTKGQFMEYLADYGHFADLPFDFIFQNMYEHYPGLRNIIEGKENIYL